MLKSINERLSKNNHSLLEYSCDGGVASINVATGRLLFTHEDITVGGNTFTMGVSHIYDSHNRINRNINMGRGWKLNIQQYLFSYQPSFNLEGFSLGDYVYIDGTGNIHKYIWEGENLISYPGYESTIEIRQYEVDNDGTIVQEFYLTDEIGNRLFFNDNGYLVKSEQLLSNGAYISKIYEYNDSQLVKVYDERHKNANSITRYLSLNYSSNLLQSITLIENGIEKEKIKYGYDSRNNLKYIIDCVNNKEKKVTCFKYDSTNKLLMAGGNQNNSCLQFVYENNKIKNVVKGYAEIACQQTDNSVYTYFYKNEIINNGRYIVTQESINRELATSEIIGNSIQTNNSIEETTYTYDTYCTKVMNQKGVEFIYHLNKKGFTTGVFEVGNNGNLMTLTKDGGISVMKKGSTNTINGSLIGTFNFNTRNSLIYNNTNIFDMTNFNNFKTVHRNASIKHYVCSFWLRLKTDNINYAKAVFRLPAGAATSRDYTAYVDYTAYNTWQYVTIPIWFDDSMAGAYISECSIMISSNIGGSYDISNMRFAPGTNNKLMFSHWVDKKLKDGKTYYPYDITQSLLIRVWDVSKRVEVDINLNETNYITESDILTTCKSLIKITNTSANYFLFVYCGGTKKLYTPYIKFYPDRQDINTLISEYEISKNTFTTNATTGVTTLNICYNQTTPDEQAVITKTYSYYNNKDIKEETTFKGPRETVTEIVIRDFQGRMKEEIDSYGQKIEYAYDTYGNLISTLITNTKVNSRMLQSRYKYNDETNNGKYREFQMTNEESSGVGSNQTILDSFGRLKQTTIGNSKPVEYDYDELKRLNGIHVKDGNLRQVGNSFTFDENGRLKSLRDSDTYQYKIDYDKFGNISKYSLINKNGNETLLKEKIYTKYSLSSGNSQVRNINYQTNSTLDTYLDKYDRLEKIKYNENNNEEIQFKYQINNDLINGSTYSPTFNESPTVAKIKQIKDTKEGAEYTYLYDDDNNPSGYICTKAGSQNLKVQQISSGETKYEIKNEKYITGLIYNDNLISPRVTQSKLYFGQDSTFDEIVNDNFSYKYEYKDILGRITKKENSKITTEISYNLSDSIYTSDKIMWIKHGIGEEINEYPLYSQGGELEYSYTYDESGNIKSVIETGVTKKVPYSLKPQDILEYSNTIGYTYDGLNRLTMEEIKRKGYTVDGNNNKQNYDNFNYYEYSYLDKNGKDRNRVTKVTTNNGSTYKEFELDDYNRLITFKENNNTKKSYTYGNYLNPTSLKVYDNTFNLEWIRDNLLSKYKYNEYKYNEYKYNYQGVRYNKNVYINDVQVNVDYYYDGSKLLGEDYGNDYKLRYIYDLTGICGVKCDGKDYLYVRDGQGNIIWITYRGEILVEYQYDAFGNCTERKFNESHKIVEINPIRWRGHYFDRETENYYINGRYYDPEVGQYLDSQDIENITEGTDVINGLNMYAITTDNPNKSIVNTDNILTSVDYLPDPNYNDGLSWWEKNWRKVIRYSLFAIALTTSVVLMLNPATAAYGAKMFLSGLNYAISSVVIGGLIDGIASAKLGHGFWNGVTSNIVNNFMDGFIIGVVMHVFTSGFRPSNCFIAGTLILTESGHKAIENIEVGDKVWAYDEETGEQQLKEVVTLFRGETKEWIHIYINDEKITCTKEHPFLIEGKGWVNACDLVANDGVLLYNGNRSTITQITREVLETPEVTYNFEVRDYHTYYVGAESILVHNMCAVETPVDDALDWSVVGKNGETRVQHVMKHATANPNKVAHTVFNGNPVSMTNQAWASRGGVTAIIDRGASIYNIPFANAGTLGENAIRIATMQGTNKLLSAYPIFIP